MIKLQVVYGKNKKEEDYFLKKRCPTCKRKFISLYHQQKFCSNECRIIFNNQKRKAELSRTDTLCWDCQNACGGCSWSEDFIPVKGWKAKPTKLKGYGDTHTDSFHVIKCPKYIKDKRS